ncbi:MAG TPA: nucleotidyltransferase domain-containing protein [Thermoanaerobaculia bacterium]|nr:nucleotidyltransferase domain-containing protein [Thermoanaerobaculia bacterium]
MQSASSSGVRVIRDEPEKIEAAVVTHARDLRARRPEIVRILWFGSRVTGRPTRSSDVDLCVIVSDSDRAFIERGAAFHPGPFPTGIDLFVYTEAEFAELARTSPGWVREILRGREL